MTKASAGRVTLAYRPTKGDRAFVAALRGPNPSHALDRALLIRRVSDAYLADLASINAAGGPGGLKALTDIELARRAQRPARLANRLAGAALTVAALSLLVSAYAVLRPPAAAPAVKAAASVPRLHSPRLGAPK